MVSPRASRREKSTDLQFELAGLDLGEIEDVVDEAKQGVGRRLHHAEVFALLGVERRVEGQLGHADDAVHGRADLVAHVGQELAFTAAGGLGDLLGLMQVGVGNGECGGALLTRRSRLAFSVRTSASAWRMVLRRRREVRARWTVNANSNAVKNPPTNTTCGRMEWASRRSRVLVCSVMFPFSAAMMRSIRSTWVSSCTIMACHKQSEAVTGAESNGNRQPARRSGFADLPSAQAKRRDASPQNGKAAGRMRGHGDENVPPGSYSYPHEVARNGNDAQADNDATDQPQQKRTPSGQERQALEQNSGVQVSRKQKAVCGASRPGCGLPSASEAAINNWSMAKSMLPAY